MLELENKDLVCATNNPHKAAEFSRLFPDFEIHTPADLGIAFDYEEKGNSFLENAYGKAMSLFSLIHRPVLADDSGLSVYALNGEPGIYSARYGGNRAEKLSNGERIDYLLARTMSLSDRRCFFICCLILVLEKNRFFIAQETVRGELSRRPRGSGGFGYDPVFYLPELKKTIAELEDREKDEISHRGRAARRILRLSGPG